MLLGGVPGRVPPPRAWLACRRCPFGVGLAATPHPPKGAARGHSGVGGLLATLRTSAATTARHERDGRTRPRTPPSSITAVARSQSAPIDALAKRTLHADGATRREGATRAGRRYTGGTALHAGGRGYTRGE